ncbi:MAG TPA: tetratricopeptide repeat protein [Rhodanobacteraceae bacterium]|jgi:tetratricopeptide (TPR) repeat protein|nr:tetratricopeptide repeat protein [Rhodanobacteraceae bacterium]
MLEDLIQLHQAGRFAEAENGYRQLLAAEPENAEVLHLLGILRAQCGDLPEAYALVNRASELAPDNAASQHTLGEMYLSEARLDEAQQAYDRARQLNPNLASAHAGLGQVAFLRGDIDGAETHFRVALRADENDVQALTGLGNVAQWRGDSARALQLLTQAAGLAPGDALIQTSYARAMLDEGMLDFAGRALDNALAAKPDYALAQALRADLHVRKGEFAQAHAMFESLLARGEQTAAAHTGQGDIARAQGLHDQAIAHYDEALRAQPDLHHAAIRRADSLARSGRAPQAIDDLRWYVASHPDSVKAHIGLAQLLSQTARYDESIAVWAAAEARWPDNVNVKAQHALTLDQAGRSEEALAKAELAASSPRPALAMLRARGALLAGDPAAAVQRLQRIDERLLEGRPLLARRRERLLGLAFDGLEQWPDAVEAFMRAQRMGSVQLPDLPSLDEETDAMLRQLAGEPELADARGTPPVLLCGLPGSGVGQVAALLADQPGWFVRRERFEAMPDFISAPFDPRLLQPIDQASLAVLARRYRRPLERARVPETTQAVDWLPVLDARIIPALKRALPGTRLLIVAREPQDMLVDWLAFGWSQGYSMPDPLTGARWMRLAAAHLDLAARMLPAFRADPDALLAKGGSASRRQLGEYLGLRDVAWGPLARGARRGRGGLPVCFTAGHAAHYREVLSEAFAALEG